VGKKGGVTCSSSPSRGRWDGVIDEWKRERAVKNPNNGEGCVSLVNARVPVAVEKRTHRKPLLMRPLPVLLSLSALIVVGAFLFRFARPAPGRLEVTEARQLTYMGDALGRILTDGRRIYFHSPSTNQVRYVSVNGGEVSSIQGCWRWLISDINTG